MKQFNDRQRIMVVRPEILTQLRNKTGTVVRLRRCDGAAWVDMEEDLPDGLRVFPCNDDRRNHVLLYPHECIPA